MEEASVNERLKIGKSDHKHFCFLSFQNLNVVKSIYNLGLHGRNGAIVLSIGQTMFWNETFCLAPSDPAARL